MHLANTGHFAIKLLWGTFILLGMVACFILVSQAIGQYNEFNFSTMAVIRSKVNMSMPAITLCSYGNISGMLLQCTFGYAEETCFFENLTNYAYESSEYRQDCIRLNLSENKSEMLQLGPGWNNGYSLIFYSPNYDDEIKFGVTDTNTVPVDVEINQPLNLGTFDILMTKTEQTSLGEPYSQCRNSPGYRQVNCVQECYFQKMSEICQCQFPRNCSTLSAECSSAWRLSKSRIENQCLKEACPEECEKVKFELETKEYSRYQFDAGYFASYRNVALKRFANISELTDEEFKRNLVYVSFSYKRLDTLVI